MPAIDCWQLSVHFHLRYKCISECVFFENSQADISIEGLSTLDIIMKSFTVPL